MFIPGILNLINQVLKNKYLYIANQTDNVSEGGMSRNNAFYQFFKSKNYAILNAYDKNYLVRVFRNFKFLLSSVFLKEKKIVMHQSSLALLFPMFTWQYLGFLYKAYLNHLAKNNSLYIEVNDLPVEQSKDLELGHDKNHDFFQNIVYTIKGGHYIYASHEMEKYAREKYKQTTSGNQVIINGGNKTVDGKDILNELNIKIDQSKINFIYAGSLNKGRQIEQMIDVFSDLDANLYLIGGEGAWINDRYTHGNIKYLGIFKEEIAQIITSRCDMGIIPYDAARFYYNLCYPTKVSFYICSGIPILSTPLKETQNVLGEFDLGYFADESHFHDIIKNMSKESIGTVKKNVSAVSDLFTWEKILSHLIIN